MNHSAHPNKNNNRRDSRNSNRTIAIVIGILLVIALLLVAFRGCEGDKPIEAGFTRIEGNDLTSAAVKQQFESDCQKNEPNGAIVR